MTAAMDITISESVHAALRAFIAKRVADESEVDDLLQEVFLRMHRRIDSLKDPRRIVSWLYQIARHIIVDHYRSARRRRETPSGLARDMEGIEIPVLPSIAESGRLHMELAGCLRPMVDRLAMDYRDAVTLVELEGLTQRAAATRLGLSLSGMKSRVQRGRRQLKQMLEDCCLIQLDSRQRVMDYERRTVDCEGCPDAPSISMEHRSRG